MTHKRCCVTTTIMTSITASLKCKKGLHSSQRRTKDISSARRVSPLPPALHESSSDAASCASTTTASEKSLQSSNGSRILSSSSSCQESASSSSDGSTTHEEGSTKEKQQSPHRPCASSMETQASPPPYRRFKQSTKWFFHVGEHADERSHGIKGSRTTRRWNEDDFDEDVQQFLGQGSFSSVRLAIDRDRKDHVALKQVSKEDTSRMIGGIKSLRNEVEIQTR